MLSSRGGGGEKTNSSAQNNPSPPLSAPPLICDDLCFPLRVSEKWLQSRTVAVTCGDYNVSLLLCCSELALNLVWYNDTTHKV